jgi:hypothetical protein
MADSTSSSAVPGGVGATRESLERELIDELSAGRRAMLVGATGVPSAAAEVVGRTAAPPTVHEACEAETIVWDGVGDADLGDASISALEALAVAGRTVVVSGVLTERVATRLASALPSGVAFREIVVEAVALVAADASHAEVPLALADMENAAERFVVVGGAAAVATPGRARATARPVRGAYLAALASGYRELLLANARLARGHLGHLDAAAASGSITFDRLTEQLERERQLAIDNDRYFQAARARLQQPQYRLVDALTRAALHVPGMRRAARVLRGMDG